MDIFSKNSKKAITYADAIEIMAKYPKSYDWIANGGVKTMLIGGAIEAACVTGFTKTKNPVARVAFGTGAAFGMILTAAGGWVMGSEIEAIRWHEEQEALELEPEDYDENEPEEPENEDDSIIIE